MSETHQKANLKTVWPTEKARLNRPENAPLKLYATQLIILKNFTKGKKFLTRSCSGQEKGSHEFRAKPFARQQKPGRMLPGF